MVRSIFGFLDNAFFIKSLHMMRWFETCVGGLRMVAW
jgi:hypothetical protein